MLRRIDLANHCREAHFEVDETFAARDRRLGGSMSSLADLDRSKVVDIDLGSHAFKQNARAHLAEWAKRPPFYVFSSGPPQVVCGRYADVHEVFSDTERFSSEMPKGPGFEQFDKFMGVQFITQMDGERHARIRRLLMPAFSARSLIRLESRITEIIEGMLDKIERGGNEFDGMQDYGAQLVVGALLTAMANLDERQQEIFLAFHEVLPLTTYTKPGEPFAPECVRAFTASARRAQRRTTRGATRGTAMSRRNRPRSTLESGTAPRLAHPVMRSQPAHISRDKTRRQQPLRSPRRKRRPATSGPRSRAALTNLTPYQL